MEITLRIDGKDKTFVNSFVPFEMRRKALELDKYATQKNADPIKLFDKQAAFIVEVFGNQFTVEEFKAGFNAIGAQDALYDLIAVNVLGQTPRDVLEEQERRLGKMLEQQAQENKQK
ncbi:phage tail assembly chaperone G [Shouchella clausii]|jgi:hypothetical protein|uniref:phage tail assembly chaperone G n=1 Tax=Shouchella clausii TaxID=79880 RepID=UPI000B97B324|nr:hypothetical protein [Shouchella clausii]AST97294.1 hypothetical protein BC8716_15560 [Shouchella clausii]MBU8597254.1 hypothetical protein [Shouchella clausii]MCR1287852.1 hypothetical protein [Shouchella clausii]MCY1106448.1 hypothetical protein [Shouchella clausii]MEB5473198.1 hypothetical protein [Shouchella clausii]